MKTSMDLNEELLLVEDNGLKYIQFKCFQEYTGVFAHAFTTRIGGVSTGECSTLNLGFNRKDTPENVRENFLRICRSAGMDSSTLVFSNQVHDNKVKMVSEEDRGKGFSRESDIRGYDGLITDRPRVALVTFYADCVPVFLYDRVKQAIGVIHSGWKSTLKEIAAEAIKEMKKAAGCKPENIVAAVGPSIHACCFEVDRDVYEQFAAKFPEGRFYLEKQDRKWTVDLQGIIRSTLIGSGVPEENIHLGGICTKCRKDLFFSHRGDVGKTGSLAAMMQLRDRN